MVFQGHGIISNFYISYAIPSSSTNGTSAPSITGPWTTPQLLFEMQTDPMCAIYAPKYEIEYQGHAYPMWDRSGKTLLVSWSACNAWTRMARVEFA